MRWSCVTKLTTMPGAPARAVRPERCRYALRVFGRVVVDDARDAVDVDAAGGDVGGDERLDAAALERLRAPGRAGSANGHRGSAAARTPGRSSCLASRSAPCRVRQNTIVGPGGGIDVGGDAGRARCASTCQNTWCATATVGLGRRRHSWRTGLCWYSRVEHVDVAVERGREQQRLAVDSGVMVEQAPDLGQEAHVGHAVGFVDHDDLDLVEVDVAAGSMQVGEATGAGDEDVDAAAQRCSCGS